MHTLRCIRMPVAAVVAAILAGSASAGVELRSKAEMEQEIVEDDGTSRVIRIDAARITPGDEVLYVVAWENTGSEPADRVAITNPVPEHMECSRIASVADAVITASVDGGTTFDRPEALTVFAADGAARPAEPADFTHIRWTFTRALAPGESGQVEYRAVLQ